MKYLAILAFLLIGTANVYPSRKDYRADLAWNNRVNDATPNISAVNQQRCPPNNATPQFPHWYSSPEWWLCIFGLPTLLFLGWQAKETRKAAEAANRGMEIAKTKERAKLLLSIQPLNPIFGQIPEAKLRVTNVGESSALFSIAIAGLHISDSDTLVRNGSGYFGLKVGDSLLKSEQSSEETVWWPADPLGRYSQAVVEGEKEVVHLHGIINFRDAFDDWWRLRFHYIWRHYGGVEVWTPHLQTNISGEWEDQNREGECRIEKPSKKRWWQLRLNADPSSKGKDLR